MNRCIVCRESYDSQFTSKYQTLDHAKQFYHKDKQIITVCEFCWEKHAEFDEERDLPYIHFGQDFYPVGIV